MLSFIKAITAAVILNAAKNLIIKILRSLRFLRMTTHKVKTGGKDGKYNGNQKGFIYVSCDAKDQEEVFAKYLEPLAKDGISFWWSDSFDSKEEKNLAKSAAVVAFLTKDYVKDSKLRDTITAAVRNNKPLLCVYLEDVELDAALSMQTEAQQALFVNKYKSNEEFVEELKKAAIFDNIQVSEQQKDAQKKRSLAVIAAVAVAAILLFALVLRPLLSADKVNAETMEALGLQGMSKEELEAVTKLIIVGDEILDYKVSSQYEGTNIAYDEWDEGPAVGGAGHITAAGTISDLSGLGQLKNLKILCIEGQQIEDITPLLGLENLEILSIACNPVKSLDGIEKLSDLKSLDISCTEVSDLTPVYKLKKLSNLAIAYSPVTDASGLDQNTRLHGINIINSSVKKIQLPSYVDYLYADGSGLESVPDFHGVDVKEFTFEGTNIKDWSNLGTAKSYESLYFEVGNYPEDQIIKGLKGVKVSEFYFPDMNISSIKELSDIDIEELYIPNSPINSLDGIENFKKLRKLNVSGCHRLKDLTPLNKLADGRESFALDIDSSMIGLTDGLSDNIEISAEDSGGGDTARGIAEDYLAGNWDGGSKVEPKGNALLVQVWDDSGDIKSKDDIKDWDEVVSRVQNIADGLSSRIDASTGAQHITVNYVIKGEDEALLVIKDGEITENAGE